MSYDVESELAHTSCSVSAATQVVYASEKL